MKEWEIWSEGYAATGEHGRAFLHGTAWGESFDEACINFREPEDLKDWEGTVYRTAGSPLNLDTNPDGSYRRGPFRGNLPPGVDRTMAKGNYSIWACQLFPTEAEARISFG